VLLIWLSVIFQEKREVSMTRISESDFQNLFDLAHKAASEHIKQIGNRFDTIPNDVEIKGNDLQYALEDRLEALA
jgi:hypothetical protein